MKGWNDNVEKQLERAKEELNQANASLMEYNEAFLQLLDLKGQLSKANEKDIVRDFVVNPDCSYFNQKLIEIEGYLKSKKIDVLAN